MNLRINTVKTGVLAAAMAALTSCADAGIAEKAKQNAIPYLTAKELLEAENTVKIIDGSTDAGYVHQVTYWDSILAEHKIKDAYYDGKKYAIDAYNGLNPEKKEYPLSLSKPMFEVNAHDVTVIKENLKNQVAEYLSAKEFNNLRDNEPSSLRDFGNVDFFNDAKFWNDIRNTFRQREAFDKGVKDANDSLEIRKLPDLNGLTISK